jgi:hypothetical protein
MLCDLAGFLSQTPAPASRNSRKIDKSQIANLKLEIEWGCLAGTLSTRLAVTKKRLLMKS